MLKAFVSGIVQQQVGCLRGEGVSNADMVHLLLTTEKLTHVLLEEEPQPMRFHAESFCFWNCTATGLVSER